jgi:hypothetical protein
MINYITQMYSSRNTPAENPSSGKNPNRVAGGIRGQGANTIAMLGEDGVERILPTQKYVQALEEQIRQQQVAITTFNRKLTRLSTAHDHLAARATSST